MLTKKKKWCQWIFNILKTFKKQFMILVIIEVST